MKKIRATISCTPPNLYTYMHGRTGHIFIGVAASFPIRSMFSGSHPQGGRQAGLRVAARGCRAGGETACYPYENVARTPMHNIPSVCVSVCPPPSPLPPDPPPPRTDGKLCIWWEQGY